MEQWERLWVLLGAPEPPRGDRGPALSRTSAAADCSRSYLPAPEPTASSCRVAIGT